MKGAGATVRCWAKISGQGFAKGEVLVELDTDDSLLHLEAADAGTLGRILAEKGRTVSLGAGLAEFSIGDAAPQAARQSSPQLKSAPEVHVPVSNLGKVVAILMPQAGNTMEEGRLVAWKVKVGDRVMVGQVICEIETDKATIEFESTDAGRVAKLVAAEGDVIAVKQPIALLAENDADASSAVASLAAHDATPQAPVTQAAASSKVSGGAVTPLLMPQAGNSMEEGTVIKWMVKPGDRISAGQIIYEIDTDKAAVEVEATAAGRLARIVAPVGTVVPVKQPVAFLAENDADVDAFLSGGGAAAVPPPSVATIAAPFASGAASVAKQVGGVQSNGGRTKASPAARKIAAASGLDLSSIGSGSGPEGRILSTDLNRAAAARPAATSAPASTGTGSRRPMSKMRKAIATNLQVSKQTVPHFYLKQTINADPLFAFYKAQKPATGCTLNDVILLAVGKTIQEFPAFRSHVEGNEIVESPSANIGVAVSVDDGLVVPVVMAVDRHTLASLPAEAKRIVETGRKGRLENVGKGVFTISNMGMLGVEEFAAIINPPESGILAVSAVRESVIVKDGAMRAGRVMSLTLSVDHRVVDGAVAATFMGKLKERLENPQTLL